MNFENNKFELSIIMPIYREAKNISNVIEAIFESLKDINLEIVVVDDNSLDGTKEIIDDYINRDLPIRLFIRENERGLTSAIQYGIDRCQGEYVAWMDCDMSQHPREILALIGAARTGVNVVVASRFIEGGGDTRFFSKHFLYKFQAYLSWIINRFASLVFFSSFQDWTSGYILVKRSVLNEARLRGDYGEYFIELIHRFLRDGHEVLELPYVYTPREFGESKTAVSIFGFLKRGVKYVRLIFDCRIGQLNRYDIA